ncbi:MAG: hypothetical protein ACFFBH_07490 [Promethearchaeota archaeon]
MKREKIKQIIFFSLTLISIFLLVINFIPIFVVNEGITTQFSGNLWYDREVYVNESNPDMNYEHSWAVFVSNSCEIYTHFNLELLPKETEKIYLIMYYYDFFYSYPPPVKDIELNLILVDSNWNTSVITWNNKPEHEEIIDTFNASDITQDFIIQHYDFEKSIDLTEFIENNHLNEISFCVNVTQNNVGLNTSAFLGGIQLIWNYEQVLISNTTIITSSIIFSMLIGILLYARKDIYSCQSCKTKRKLTDKFCSSCRNEFDKDMIVKGADYQLTLAFLWLFALFEGGFLIWEWFIYVITGGVLPLFSIIIFINWIAIALVQIIFKIKKYRKIRALLK